MRCQIAHKRLYRQPGRRRLSLVESAGVTRAVSRLAALALAVAVGPAFAELPVGGSVSAGSGAIANDGTGMVVTQSSDRMAINWQSFSIGKGNSVTFRQPSTSAVALNRVLGSDVSTIQGALRANGQVFLLNPNGVLFSPTAQVNVGGLVATTLKLSDKDFLAGRYTFAGNSAASVTNQGTIQTARGGAVALIAARIVNQGSIEAPSGAVLLGSGSKVTLDLGGPVKLQVDAGALKSQIDQGGAIRADGGVVYLTARAADSLTGSVINHTGITQARTLATGKQGQVLLLGDMQNGTVNVGGTLDASAPGGGNGGFIETSAAKVQVADSAQITTSAVDGETGTWLIDPNDYTIAATGGDMTGAALSTALGSSNVTIQSSSGATAGNGDIFVNDTVTWSANTLTLSAQRNIDINSTMNGSAAAGLALEYGQGAVAAGNTADYYINAPVNLASTGSFSTKLGSDGATVNYTIITALGAAGSTTGTDLQGMNGNLSGHYVLGADTNASATSGWNGGEGFVPIGNSTTHFTGVFNGLGHTIDGLTINRSIDYQGLFGVATDARIRNIGLIDVNIVGQNWVGALVGEIGSSTGSIYAVSNSYASGTVTGNVGVGGLVGRSVQSTMSDSYANVVVTGGANVGGLLGYNDTYATVSGSYAFGSVNGNYEVGGLVGYNENYSTIRGSYATGAVNGYNDVGGLTGLNEDYSTISDSYATGAVNGNMLVGGLVGSNTSGAGSPNYAVSHSYSTGAVTGNSYVGGLIGYTSAYNTILNSYWDVDSSGQTSSAGGVGKTTAEMQSLSTFTGAGWNIDSASGTGKTWRIYDGQTYPLLRSFLTPIIVAANNDTTVYDGIAYSGGNGYSLSVSSASVLGSASYSGSSQGAINVGSYVLKVSGLYSSQQGYDISYAAGTLAIKPAPLTVTANNDSKTYDSTAYSGGNGVSYSGFVAGDNASVLGGTLAYGGTSQGAASAGSYTITPSGLTSSNYSINFANGILAINPRSITVTADNQSKTYGDVDPTFTWRVTGGSLVGSDSLYGTATRPTGENVGSYAIDPGTLYNSNYIISAVDGTLTINPRSITVTANDLSKTYGAADPTFTWRVTGGSLVSGDTLYGTATRTTGEDVGTYAIDPGTLYNSNYTINSVDGALTINPAPLIVTADSGYKVYDQSPYSGGNGVSYSGFANGDDASVLGGTLTYGGTSQGAVDVGRYTIVPAGLTASNYSISFVDGTLSIISQPPAPIRGAIGSFYHQIGLFSDFGTVGRESPVFGGTPRLLSAGVVAGNAPLGERAASSASALFANNFIVEETTAGATSRSADKGQPSNADILLHIKGSGIRLPY